MQSSLKLLVRSAFAQRRLFFRALRLFMRLAARTVKGSGSSRDADTGAGCQAQTQRRGTYHSEAGALPEGTASDFGFLTLVNVLADGRIFGIADLNRTVIDSHLSGLPAAVVVFR